MSRSICSFGSWIDDDGRVTTTEQTLSAVPAIQRCRLICGMVYRLEGSNTSILRMRLSQSGDGETIRIAISARNVREYVLNKYVQTSTCAHEVRNSKSAA